MSRNEHTAPTVTPNRDGDGEQHNHPAFGTVVLSNISSTGTTLFGSRAKHTHLIGITINRAHLNRHLSTDWIHGDQEVIQIWMTPAQFTQCITSPGRGEGTPCTIVRDETHHSIPGILPIENEREVFRAEIQKRAQRSVTDLLENLDRLDKAVEAPSKKELRDIAKDLRRHTEQFSGGIGFVVGQAEKAVEQTLTAAKIELEAHVGMTLRNLGTEALASSGTLERMQASLPQLPSPA